MSQNCALLVATVALGFVLGGERPLLAQSYPDKPIKIIVPGAPGGPTDLPARIAWQLLPPKLGQPVVIENRPGAAGATGARAVAAAAPDGHTLLAGNTSVFAVIPAVSASAGYDPVKDFAAVAGISESYQILVVHAASPWRSVAELVAHAKANPGRVNYAHTGRGGLPHLAAELFKTRAGVDFTGVPYKGGGESVTGVLGRQVDATFESITILLPLIRDGKLRALAITSRARTPLAPDLPTMIEAGIPDYEVLTFNGIVAPAGTPVRIVALINAIINDGLRSPELQDTIGRLGAVSKTGTPEEFAQFIAAQNQKWSAVAQVANVRID
jgi:tripartite-type tricarboxylate transporter receptor subunit TctC